MKKTSWFPYEIKPKHVGLYECSVCAPKIKHYWNGKEWLTEGSECRIPLDGGWLWRGLAEKPK